MSISLAAISAVLLLSLATPFIYFGWASRKAKIDLQKTISKLASEYGLTINEKEQWRQKLIALDAKNRKLLFLENTAKPLHEVIDLKRLSNINVEVAERTLQSGQTVLDSVALSFHFEKGAAQTHTKVVFYDFETEFNLEDDLTRVKIWKSRIAKACNIQENLKAIA